MKLSDGIEWAAHTTLLLAALPAGGRLSGKALAAFHDLSESYLAKHLNALVRAKILQSSTGPYGGFSLARPPEEISMLDIVEAIEGKSPLFRCTNIRRNGPCAIEDPKAYVKPCGISSAMHRAEAAWRTALSKELISDQLQSFIASADRRIVALGAAWIGENMRESRK